MKRCRCCHQEWPIEFYTPVGRWRRSTCRACRIGCHGTHYAAVKAYRARLRADVLAVRTARAA